MSAPKFSPGPWGVAIGKRTSVVQLGVTGAAVAVCNYDNGPTERANARLIAAAPELYEALARIMPFVDDAEDVQQLFPESAASNECREAVKLCRAALAKAVQP